jgi:hypothetical protein
VAARRALLLILIIHTKLPEKRLHVSHILPEIIQRLVHSLFGHLPDLANDVCVAFIIRKPPVVDIGELPDGGKGSAETRGDDVPRKKTAS